MLAQALSIFFMKLSVGICPWLSLISIQDTGKSFFRLLMFLSFSSMILGIWAGPRSPDLIRVLYGLVTFSIYCFLGRYQPKKMDRYWVLLFILGSLVIGFEAFQLSDEKTGVIFVNMLLGALLLGSGLTSMVLGHWYLIRPGLSFHFLIRAAGIFFVMAAVRMIWVMAMLSKFGQGSLWEVIQNAGDILFLTRFLWGGALPLFFVVFAYRCAKIHSNRSATGILYFSTASLFMGELLADYLTLMSRIPI